jgi:hypothetical protein
MNKETGGPAFPALELWNSQKQEFIAPATHGMTLRDYFAAKALQGLLEGDPENLANTGKKLAPFCYEIADAMLGARK